MFETQADNEHRRLIEHDISISKFSGFIQDYRSQLDLLLHIVFWFVRIEVSLLLEALEQAQTSVNP